LIILPEVGGNVERGKWGVVHGYWIMENGGRKEERGKMRIHGEWKVGIGSWLNGSWRMRTEG
jgi:hypothetical protein